MSQILPAGLRPGHQLGEPFQRDRFYVEERDPALLRDVGAPLTEETYELLDHCDRAGTGNGDSKTQASEISAQWKGKERLPAALRVLLSQLPDHFVFENTEVERPWIPSESDVSAEVAAFPGSFEEQQEPRLYLGRASEGVVAPKELKPAIELMLLVIDPENQRKPKYVDRKEVDSFLKDTNGLSFYRPDQIERFEAVAKALDAQIQDSPKAKLPSLDLPQLGRVEVSAVEIPLSRNRRVEVKLQLDYQLELTRTADESKLDYVRSGSVEITVPAGFKAIFRDDSGERLLAEGTHRVMEARNEGSENGASIEVFDKSGTKVVDRCFEIPAIEFSVSLDEYAGFPVAHNGVPAKAKLASLEQPEGEPLTAKWIYGAEIEEDQEKVAHAAEIFTSQESSVADGRYRLDVGSRTVDFEKYSDSLYRVAIDDGSPEWLTAGRAPSSVEQDDEGIYFLSKQQSSYNVAFNPRSGELTVGYYGNHNGTEQISSRHIEREQQIDDPSDAEEALAIRMLWTVGSANDKDFDAAKAELTEVPAEILLALQRSGLEVNVCRGSIIEHHQELAGQHARGTPPWVMWDSADGFYDWGNKSITVSTTNPNGHRADLRQGALLKQVGHAIDDIGGGLSKSAEFRAAYKADLAALKKNDEAFLIQPGDDGREQAFAETFGWYLLDSEKLEQYPALLQYWESDAALKALGEKTSRG